jgi:hypothetical protein
MPGGVERGASLSMILDLMPSRADKSEITAAEGTGNRTWMRTGNRI